MPNRSVWAYCHMAILCLGFERQADPRTLTPKLAGPLEVSCGDAAPGLLGWVGASGGSWAAWRFPHRRRVAALLLAAPPALFRGCSFELSRQDARAGGSVAVPVRLEAWGVEGGADDAPAGCLLIVPTVRRACV